jgi:hypothetical protein
MQGLRCEGLLRGTLVEIGANRRFTEVNLVLLDRSEAVAFHRRLARARDADSRHPGAHRPASGRWPAPHHRLDAAAGIGRERAAVAARPADRLHHRLVEARAGRVDVADARQHHGDVLHGDVRLRDPRRPSQTLSERTHPIDRYILSGDFAHAMVSNRSLPLSTPGPISTFHSVTVRSH